MKKNSSRMAIGQERDAIEHPGKESFDGEIARFLKLTPKDIIIPISMQVPRKSELFQDDIFPDTFAGTPAQSAADYMAGGDADPVTMSLEPDGMQKKSEAPAPTFQKKEAEKELSPKEIKEEWEALKKRVAYLEAELAKRDAKIKDLEEAAGGE